MTQQEASGPVIWCLGMYASGSTWAFNVVRQIVQANAPGRFRTAFLNGKEIGFDWNAPGKVTVLKSHEISGESAVLEIARRTSKILITVRDPRDAVVSLMQAHQKDFGGALDLVVQSASLCSSFAKDRRAKRFVYETGFFENAATVADLAGHLGYRLDAQAAKVIHDSLQRDEVEKHIAQLPKLPGILRDPISGDFLDPRTQWHSHHAGRNGEVGKWRAVLTDAQTGQIMSELKYYFDLFGVP